MLLEDKTTLASEFIRTCLKLIWHSNSRMGNFRDKLIFELLLSIDWFVVCASYMFRYFLACSRVFESKRRCK